MIDLGDDLLNELADQADLLGINRRPKRRDSLKEQAAQLNNLARQLGIAIPGMDSISDPNNDKKPAENNNRLAAQPKCKRKEN
jgi:hypothetical protein